MAAFADWIAAHEILVRGASFVTVFALMAIWEIRAPARALTISKSLRWANNIGLVVLNTVLLRLVFPAAAVGMAAWVASEGWGVLNQVALPTWLAVVLTVVVLDFVIWLQHVMVHAIPALW